MQLLCQLFLTFSNVVSGYNPMMFISSILPLNGSNYNTWPEKLEISLALSDNDLALISSCPTEPVDPARKTNETDAASLLGSVTMQK